MRSTGLIIAALLVLGGCHKAQERSATSLSVAATAVPHAEILEEVKPILAKQGVDLDIRVFNDYVQPDVQVAEGKIDVNYFQTSSYLDEFNKARGTKLVTLAGVHVEPLGGYSRKWKTLGQLPQGATIAIPNDGSTSGRALILLQKAGLIKLAPGAGILGTPRDIVSNPHGYQFKQLEAATLPRVVDQVDMAMINTNYALEAKLDPAKDALVIEGKDSPYVNYVVGPESAKADPKVQKLIAALRSPETKAFIENKYKGAVIPAF
jgi:D-methionine transport system substrate-binding protein